MPPDQGRWFDEYQGIEELRPHSVKILYAGVTGEDALPSRTSQPLSHRRYDGGPDSEQSSAAAAHDGALRCAMAIELSKKSWIVAVNTPISEKISRYTLKGWAFAGT
jgi:hypothetical protein